ncbi:MAG: hypothetical protein MH252_01350 [Thermosynechococcaceae cyanobacterium MS004]|nr:hypothetical protein [Thermosynechococcaceae cyanobacterium MS004]
MTINLEEQNLEYDAEILKEEIENEQTESPAINVQKDYEASKKFSTPDPRRSDEEVSPSLGSSFKTDNPDAQSSAEGNPENFLSMAQEISPESDQKEG